MDIFSQILKFLNRHIYFIDFLVYAYSFFYNLYGGLLKQTTKKKNALGMSTDSFGVKMYVL